MQKIACVLVLLLPVFIACAQPSLKIASVSAGFTFANNACSGTAVQFTASVSSGTPPFTYSWDFGDGGIGSAQVEQHTFTSLGCASGRFTVRLKVKDVLNDSTTVINPVDIKQSPNVTLQDLANPFSPFSNCGNSPTDVTPLFIIRPGLGSPTDACISSFSVNWGDGSPVLNGLTAASFPLPPHTYATLGIFNLVITAQGTNGCSTTKTYPVLNLANPAVGIEGPRGTSGCAPIAFWFKLKGYELNSPGTTYEWDFGDKSSTITWNTPITVDSINHVFSTTSCGLPLNQFTVKVTAKNACDTKDATVNNIKIFQKPVANFNLPPGGSACVATALTFTTSAGVMAYNSPDCNRTSTYAWSSDDGGAGTGTSYTHTFTTPGSHNVTLIAFGGCGNDTITKPISIISPPAPPAAGSNSPVCSPDTLKLTASSITGATYAWTGPLSFTSTLQNPTRANTSTGMSGTYSVTASLNGCASAPATISVLVNAKPARPATSLTSIDYCVNATATPLTATGATGNTLYWYTTATGGTPGTTAPTPNTTTADTIIFYVSQINLPTGCESDRLAITVRVNPIPAITGTFINPTSCTTSNGTITLSGLQSTTAYTVLYTLNSGTPVFRSTSSNAGGIIIIAGLGSGTYTNITATSGGCPSNAVGPITLTTPSAPAAPTAGSNSPLCSGSTLNLTASTVASATYNWTGPLSFTSTLQNPTRANTSTGMSGSYSVTVTVNGCTSAAATISVNIGPIPASPGVTSPVNYCQNAPAVPLMATATAGYTLNWYTTIIGGTPTTTAPTPSTAVVGSVTYYVSQVSATPPACESQPRSSITVKVSPTPAISASAANPTGCASSNGTITLTGLTADSTYTVQYTRNSGTPVSLPLKANASSAIIIANLSAGTYSNITATLNGCSSNTAGPFTLTSFSAPATPAAGSNSPLCAGSSLNLTASAAVAGATYMWTGPGGYTSTLQNPVIINSTTAMSGTYSVTVSLNGCISAPASVNVVVNASGTVTAGSNSPLCAGGTLTLLAGVNSTSTFSWTWSGPNNFSSNQQNPSIQNVTAAASGTYTVTASSPIGSCPSSATTSVLVTAQPTISNASAASPGNCSAGTGSITLQGLAPNTTYAVQYAKNGTAQAAVAVAANGSGSLIILNLSGGVYSNITVSQGGCVSNTVGPITLADVNILPPAPKATSNSPLCTGSILQLGASVTASGTLAYQWSGPNGFASTSQNPFINNITLAAAGKYYVTVSTGSCVSVKDSVDVQIGSNPVVSLGPDLVLAPGSRQTLSPSIQNGPISQYLWMPAINLSCTTCASPVVTPQGNTSYILKVTNSYGCSASDTISIKTLCEGSNVFIPDAFTPDGDGLNDKFMIRASGPIRVKYFRVFNRWGELVFERMNFLPNDPAYGWDGKVKGVAVPPDVFVYTALVTCDDGASFTYKGNITVLK